MIHLRPAIAPLLLLAALAHPGVWGRHAPNAAADEPGGVVLPGDSRPAAGKLDVARARLAEGKADDAIPLLQSILEANGDDLVPLGEGRSAAARIVCHSLLSRLEPAGLARYRARADAPARRLLEQAGRDGDTALRLVQESFCSTPAAEALDRLGDLAFLRGRFDEAEGWWRLLAPMPPARKGDSDVLAYPDASADVVARAHAKQVLARLFRLGPAARPDLDDYAALHPKASGALAGRRGLYAEILAAVALERQRQPARPAGDWLTFGGDASRGRVAAAPPRFLDQLGRFCRAGRPTWTFNLGRRDRVDGLLPRGEPLRQPLAVARLLAFHPVVVGRHAVVADPRFVTAYDLRTGNVERWYDAGEVVGGLSDRPNLPVGAEPRYTLTATDNALFARLGSPAIRDARARPRQPGRPAFAQEAAGESVLVRLSMTRDTNGRVTAARPAWLVRALDPGRKELAVFEGAPVVHDGRVFIAATRAEGGRFHTAIHCYPAHAEDSSPAPLWRTEVCETRDLGPGTQDNTPRYRHHLLTLAGPRLVYCSHSGAVVALDPRTGRRAWALRYPRRDGREPDDVTGLRDLAPPLFAEGRVYVAPADSDRLYCLDAYTGAVLWERDRLDVVHLVGVGKGRLIFTTWRNPRQGLLHPGGLRAVMAHDGADKGGWSLPDDGGGLLPLGRPILVGDLVLWPTARPRVGVFAVRQEDGLQADNPTLLHGIPSGNLVYANGCLLVADAQYLHAFVPPEQVEEDSAQARGAAGASPRARLSGLLRSARALERAGEKERAKAVWGEILASADLRGQTVRDEDGLPQRAGWVAEKGLGVVKASGGHDPPVAGSERGTHAAHSPWEESLRLSLAAEERFLAVPDTDQLWTTQPRTLLCRSRNTGSVGWQASLPFTPTWGRPLDRLLLVGGSAGLAALDRATGKLAWCFAAPPTPRYPGDGSLSDELPPRPLADFHLAGPRLFATQGERCLLCLDARAGAVLWQRWAPGAGFEMPPPRGRFHSLCPAGRDRLLVQSTTWFWQIDARSGAVLTATPAPTRTGWPRQPVPLGDARVGHIPDADHVELLDLASGATVWTFALPGRTTRTGEAPVLLDTGGPLVVVEPNNLGARLHKLDRATGKPLWPQPPLVRAEHFAPSSWLATAEALYHAAAGRLSAWSLATGKPLWQRQLPGEGTWRLQRCGKALLAWLDRSAAIRFRFRWLPGSLQWQVGPLPSASAWEVLCLDAGTGAVAQRLSLDPEWLPRQPTPAWGRGISLMPLAGVDRPTDAVAGPAVVSDRLGLVVAVGNCVKAFSVPASTK